MKPSIEARRELVISLREAAKYGGQFSVLFNQSANEIEDLALLNYTLEDKLDFHMSDQLSSAVMSAVAETIKRETGHEAKVGPFYVNNANFAGQVADESPGGFVWHIKVLRSEKEVDSEQTD